jgi:L-amino acid N-acyltransferase YncA
MTIRIATPDDAVQVQAIYAPIVATTIISFELDVPTVDEMRARIANTLLRFPWLVDEDDDGNIGGYVYASKHRERAAYQWSVDVTAYVREDCRGRGIGSRLYRSLFAELVKLGYYQAFAGIALPNGPSIALHESVGFTPLGIYHKVGYKLGAWHDVGWWQCTLQPSTSPSEPLPFEAGRTRLR